MSDTTRSSGEIGLSQAGDDREISLSCPPLRVVEVGIGEKALIASDFFLSPTSGQDLPNPDQPPLDRFISALNGWDGPGVVVVAGNLLDLLTPYDPLDEKFDLPLLRALRRLSQRGEVRIYLIPGFRDARLAFDRRVAQELRKSVPFELALKIELHIHDIQGVEKVLVTSGREFDSAARASDPYSPSETPLAQHLITDLWPRYLSDRKTKWFTGVDRLKDPASSIKFLISRMTYRRISRFLPWVAVPLLLAFLIKIPLVLSLPLLNRLKSTRLNLGPQLAFVGISTLIDAALVFIAILILLRIFYSRLISNKNTASSLDKDFNVKARMAAAELIEGGYSGVITGHSLTPELAKVGRGFFACTGSVSRIYVESAAALGLPSIFRPKEQATWIEIDAGAALHARLLSRTTFAKGDSFLERALSIKRRDKEMVFGQLASYPNGKDYREDRHPVITQIRSRRIAAALIFLVGVLNLASALTPPIRSRLHLIQEFLPVTVSTTANALVAMASIGLMFLAAGVRKGQRQAWAFTLILSIGAASLNLIKGGDFEEALTLIAVSLYLISKRNSFKAPVDRPSLRRGLRTMVLGSAAIIMFSTVVIFGYIFLIEDHRVSFWNVLIAVSERMVGFSTHPLPGHAINEFATPALAFIGICLAAIVLFMAFRPVVDRSRGLSIRFGTRTDQSRARAIVNSYSKGTLDYFALRDDKRYFFAHGCVVAYANYGSVALVSPDPIGPETTKNQAWSEFLTFANSKGWIVGVLGADESWLEQYSETGMSSIYVGDEAIVAVRSFQLNGKKYKGLRQAVGRIRKYGYTAEFHDPSNIDPGLSKQLMAVMTQSRKGEVERGFSMTLGRAFDPSDKGLLLTVCKDCEGKVVGFCQWVPAPGINGFSLDLMRRDLGDHPNGLTDFMIVSTIEHLRDKGYENLSLNFATMRAVLSGEMDSMTQKMEKWFLKRMSDSMQIESLWRFNSKFDPRWYPRYVVYDTAEHTPALALAIARAEALWELPIIGRFLSPSEMMAKAD